MNILDKIKKFFEKIRKDMRLAEDEEFIDDTRSSMMTKVTPYANALIYIVVAFFIIFIIWASVLQIDIVVNANGTVISSSRDKLIQSLDGGIVSEILVKEGQTVKKNQPLIILDATQYQSQYGRSYQKYLTMAATVAILEAEVENKEFVEFPPEVRRDTELVERETNLFNTRQKSYHEQLNNFQDTYATAKKEMQTYKEAFKEGIVSKIDYLRSQRVVSEAQQHILELKSKHSEDARSALVQANSDLSSLREELKGYEDKIKRTTLLSPVNGIVKKIHVTAQYEVISPSMVIMDIVPVEDTLLVETKVKPADIAFIKLGQPAIVQITAYDYTIYGSLKGVVEYVSANVIEESKPSSASNPALSSYYVVHVRTDKNYLGVETHKLPILPGMDANVKIVTGKKAIIHYLLKPLVKAKEEALRER